MRRELRAALEKPELDEHRDADDVGTEFIEKFHGGRRAEGYECSCSVFQNYPLIL